jgi:hemerythrin-like domain-containing protein
MSSIRNDGTDKTNSTTSAEDYNEDEKEDSSLVPTKAKEVGKSLKEKVKSVGKKTEEKTKELKDKSMQTTGIGPAKDAHDIQALGTTRLEKLTADFENMMSEIENESDYRMQEKQLGAYKKLLEQHIDVIDSRLKMVKRIQQ